VKHFEATLRNVSGKTELLTRESVDVVEVLGAKFVDASEELCRKLEIRGGVQVASLKESGFLARARVKRGFVITHINDQAVYTVADLRKITDKVRSVDGIYPDGRAASYVAVE
jgi:S1-C subfamily serine protease